MDGEGYAWILGLGIYALAGAGGEDREGWMDDAVTRTPRQHPRKHHRPWDRGEGSRNHTRTSGRKTHTHPCPQSKEHIPPRHCHAARIPPKKRTRLSLLITPRLRTLPRHIPERLIVPSAHLSLRHVAFQRCKQRTHQNVAEQSTSTRSRRKQLKNTHIDS